MADELANDLRYLVKLMDWAAGEGFGNCDGLPDPDETLSEMWERYDPAKGADDYSADALADLMVARLTEEVAAQAREIEGLRALLNMPDAEWEGELTAEERGMIDAAWEQHKAAEPCNIPPPGWWCSRGKGHEGPCAARALTGGPHD